MHVQIKAWSDPDQLGAEGPGDRDGSSLRIVPEIRCVALHTDPRQVHPRLTGGKNKQI